MKPINAIGFALSLTIIFGIGCEQVQDQIGGKSTEPGVTSVSPDDIGPDAIQTGTVVIADAADEWGVDEYVLNAAAIIDDRLELSVSYSGGCKNHQFTLVCSSFFLESDPVQLGVSLLPQLLPCLSQKERTIVKMKFYQGLKAVEIAKRIGLSQGRVSQLSRTALAKLSKAYLFGTTQS